MDEGFAAYALRGEGSSSEAEELVMHFFVTCDDEASVTAANSMTYEEELSAAVEFFEG